MEILTQLIQQLINGVAQGSIYALIALGYTMVYGIVRLINFAHGDVYMLGAYAGFLCATRLNAPFAVALLAAMVLCALIGVLIERVAYRPLRGAPKISLLITAIGISLLIENLTQAIDPQSKSYPETFFPSQTWDFWDSTLFISSHQILILVTTLVLLAGLQFLVHHTRLGKAMRAVSFDRDAASLMGIHVDRTISFTFAVGSALAGAAGILVGVYYNQIEPLMGVMAGLKAFVAAVLGGIGSLAGAVIGGMVMGVAENLVVGFSSSAFKDAIAFAILILILLLKPAGLLGRNTAEKV